MYTYLSMQQEILEKILERYGLKTVVIKPPLKGYRNSSYQIISDNETYNLIVYKREPDIQQLIKKSNQIGLYLHNFGMPVRYPLDRRILKVFAGRIPQYAGLYNYLPGSTIAWESYTRKHLVQLGKALSDLHALLKHYTAPQTNDYVYDQLFEILQNMHEYFSRPGVVEAMAVKLGTQLDLSSLALFTDLNTVLNESAHKQWLHMDFVRGNILFDADGNVCGLIDFEKAAVGHPLHDIARTLAFLYVDCKYKSAADITRNFLYSGYQKRGQQAMPRLCHNETDCTLKVLDGLVSCYLLHDYFKFLLHNPYESLHANEHFTRTRDQLLKRRVLTEVKGETVVVQ